MDPSASRSGANAWFVALDDRSPEYATSLTDHTPMVIEALERLDPSAIDGWAARSFRRLRSLDEERDEALRGFGAERDALAARIAQVGLRAVVDRELPALAEGLAGAAFHGAIRLAHALDAWERDPGPVRAREVARALAYARLRAARLPQRPRERAETNASLAEALRAVGAHPRAGEHEPGLITRTLLGRSADHGGLARGSARVALPTDAAATARTLLEEALRLMVHGRFHPGWLFTLLHGVTAMQAVGGLAARFPDHAGALFAEAAHALLCMRVAYVVELGDGGEAAPSRPWSSLVARAVASGDDHAIKLAGALDGLDTPLAAPALSLWLARLGA